METGKRLRRRRENFDPIIDNIYGAPKLNIVSALGSSEESRCPAPCLEDRPKEIYKNSPYGPLACQPGGCALTTAQQRKLKNEGLASINDGDMSAVRAFRDTFMRKYPTGIKYIGYYFLFSKYSKWDVKSMRLYGGLIPETLRTMRLIDSGPPNEIVVTDSIYEKAMKVIDAHKDSKREPFLRVLEDVKDDLDALRGLSRQKFLRHVTGE